MKFTLGILALFMSSALHLSFAHAEYLNLETEDATKQKLGADFVSQIIFEKNATAISKNITEEITSTVNNARKHGKIDHIKVIAWADREYPSKSEKKASRDDIKLAQKRAKSIADFLRKELRTGEVKLFNMAERPNTIEEIFKTRDLKVKSTLENTGSAPTSAEQTGAFALDGKTSHALILIHLKK